jgi:hypothetical protein
VNQIASTDLWFPDQQAPVGRDHGGNFSDYSSTLVADDPVRYVAWVNAGRPHGPQSQPELAPRQALHLVECRNGTGP